MKVSTLRPGLLVSLHTNVTGNVSYQAIMLEYEHMTDDGRARAKWETIKETQDPEEFKRASDTRAKCRNLITAVCSRSAHGLLCRESDRDSLEEAMEKARALADEFNESAVQTRVTINAIVGRVAADDVEAVRAINKEVRELMEDMAKGLASLNPDAVRAAAKKARELGGILEADASAKIQVAIEAARAAATRIVAAGEGVVLEIDKRAIRACTEARTMFLDIEESGEVQVPVAVARGGIEFDPGSDVTMSAAPPTAPQFEF